MDGRVEMSKQYITMPRKSLRVTSLAIVSLRVRVTVGLQTRANSFTRASDRLPGGGGFTFSPKNLTNSHFDNYPSRNPTGCTQRDGVVSQEQQQLLPTTHLGVTNLSQDLHLKSV